ncbi:unnamed protein product [Cyclocybe aegerita]|uniref:Uncharacterized protein n=1 Tax=Cyclocybe aegerita TaxID=1973307 RepID=A0A8S0W477_CYCAE|nr:unnamed protein product [Cyclocybe aegerita]
MIGDRVTLIMCQPEIMLASTTTSAPHSSRSIYTISPAVDLTKAGMGEVGATWIVGVHAGSRVYSSCSRVRPPFKPPANSSARLLSRHTNILDDILRLTSDLFEGDRTIRRIQPSSNTSAALPRCLSQSPNIRCHQRFCHKL